MTIVAVGTVIASALMVGVSALALAVRGEANSAAGTVVLLIGVLALVGALVYVVTDLSGASRLAKDGPVLKLQPREAFVLLPVSMFVMVIAMPGAYAAVAGLTDLERTQTWLVALAILTPAALIAIIWLGRRLLVAPASAT